MPEYHFETHSPVNLVVEISKGNVSVRCAETTETTVVVEGKHAEDVVVEQHGDSITVIEPGRGRIFGDNTLQVDVRRARGQQPRHPHRLGRHPGRGPGRPRAAAQRLGRRRPSRPSRGTCSSRPAPARSGSTTCAATSRSRAAPATSRSARPAAPASISTGSGDVSVETARGNTVVKTGSGDLSVGQTHGDTSFSTGSGDVSIDRVDRGRVTVKGASGDVSIGVKGGVPVWTDITTVSGTIRSDLQGAGQPQEGQDHIEVRAKTVSGDIALSEV